MRLLDDVLDILSSPDDGLALGASPGADGAGPGAGTSAPDYPERRRRAAARLRDAFSGGALPVDVFTAAAALAEGGAAAAEALAIEAVSPAAFLAEASELLAEAKRQQQEAREAVARFQSELQWARANKPAALEAPEAKQRVAAAARLEAQLDARQPALDQLEDAVKIAAGVAAAGPGGAALDAAAAAAQAWGGAGGGGGGGGGGMPAGL